ncbi:MAG: hypothetical protein GQF41_2752 [Candidatus Rifleibacterium amylolyticum]|nr:MAG: hypothetical protein GQF41_2752 [Candidatus Rifleibacterium amylolyticum]
MLFQWVQFLLYTAIAGFKKPPSRAVFYLRRRSGRSRPATTFVLKTFFLLILAESAFIMGA